MFPMGVNTLLLSYIDPPSSRRQALTHGSTLTSTGDARDRSVDLQLLWRTNSRKNAGPSFPTMFAIPQRERLHNHARHGSNTILAPWGMNKLRS
jgi:hypothetical protein